MMTYACRNTPTAVVASLVMSQVHTWFGAVAVSEGFVHVYPEMSSPFGSRRMSDGERQRMILDHLTRSGRLILVDDGLHLPPCGVGLTGC